MVVGAGGLGCPVLQYLAAAGVGTLGVIDFDVVEESNLQRQILFGTSSLGSNKALAAKERLTDLNPTIQINAYPEALTPQNALSLFNDYDIIVDGTDNFETRYLINDAAIITNKPIVYGAIFKFEGQVSVFNYRGSGTYRCLYPTPPKPDESPNCSEIGVLGVLPGIIGSLQANEVIKIICEIGVVLANKLLIYDSLNMNQIVLKFEKERTSEIITLETNYNFFCGIVASEEITLEELQKNKEKYNLLDVREIAEREVYHIGGQHISLKELPYRIEEVLDNKDLIVYCKTGVRSKKAIAFLRKKKPTLVLLNLKGGCY